MSPEHTYNEPPDVIALLNKELESCVMPSITDTSKATPEELIRDLHRVLTGNGGPTRGLIYKVASSNVKVNLLRSTMTEQTAKTQELAGLVAAQKTRCDEVQAAKRVEQKVAKAERFTIARIGAAIRENKAVIAVIIVGAAIMIHNRLNVVNAGTDRSDNTQRIEAAISHLLDIKLEQLQLIPNASTNKVVSHKPK